MHTSAYSRLSRLMTSTLPVLLLVACGQGDGPVSIKNTPATPLPDIPAGFCDPINFEILCPAVNIINFNGGATTVIDNPDKSGINLSDRVAQMQKFPDEVFGGTAAWTPAHPSTSRTGEAFTVKVWSPRPVPLLFKLDQQNKERTFSHSGSGAWEEACFDFTGDTAGAPNAGLTLIFDITASRARQTPIRLTGRSSTMTLSRLRAAPAATLPTTFSTITFDDLSSDLCT